MSVLSQSKVCIASISGAQGIKGDLKVRVYLNNPSDISNYSPLFFEDGAEFHIKVVRSLPGSIIASALTVKDRDEALKLRGAKLYVLRDQLPPVEDNTYYHADLIGLLVQSEQGEDVGIVKYVHDYGAGPLLEVFDPLTCKSVLVPFREEAVPVVELGSRVVIKDAYLSDLYQE